MDRGNPEHALDAIGIADGDLDMRFGVKSGTGVYCPPFGKDRAHRIEIAATIFVDGMKVFDYRTIDPMQKTAAAVCRERLANRFDRFS